MDSLPPGLLGNIGVVGVVLLVGWMVFKGLLVPRRTHEDILHDRDEWRAAHRISESARQVQVDQVNELLEHARTTDAFIRSLPRPDGRGSS